MFISLHLILTWKIIDRMIFTICISGLRETSAKFYAGTNFRLTLASYESTS